MKEHTPSTESTEESTAYAQLNEKQRVFVDAYFTLRFNATAAAKAAGYQHPDTYGTYLKRQPAVRANGWGHGDAIKAASLIREYGGIEGAAVQSAIGHGPRANAGARRRVWMIEILIRDTVFQHGHSRR